MSKVIEDIISKTEAMGNTMAGSKLQSLQLAEALNGYSVEAIKASISESTLNEMQIFIISKTSLYFPPYFIGVPLRSYGVV
ncbi:MAG: hypothetical protein PUD90_02035 [Clostridia bacterium]|nr:hypothetical protein [[Bacteroides] pectinophilus]MDD5872232.1 hypothetical protein [Clostridia bacterium]